MNDEEILGALRSKRENLERSIEAYLRKISSMEEHLASMKGVLAYHEQDVPEADFLPNMSVRRLFRRGEIQGYCLDALKQTEILSTRELTLHVLIQKGLDADDPVLRKKVVFSVMHTMKLAKRRRLVVGAGKRKNVLLWQLSSPARRP